MRGFKAKSQVTSYKLQVASYKKGDQGRLFLFVLRLETFFYAGAASFPVSAMPFNFLA